LKGNGERGGEDGFRSARPTSESAKLPNGEYDLVDDGDRFDAPCESEMK